MRAAVDDEWDAEDEDRWQAERAVYDRQQEERDEEEDWAMMDPAERLETYWEDEGEWWKGSADRIAHAVARVMGHMAETHSTLDPEHLVQALERAVNDVSVYRFGAPVPSDLLHKVAFAYTERAKDGDGYSDTSHRMRLYLLNMPVGVAATDTFGMPGYVSVDPSALSQAFTRMFGHLG